MKIKLSELDGKERVKFNFSVSSLEGVNLVGELQIEGTAKRLNNEYFIEGKYSARIKTQCVRCLDEIVVDLGENEFYGKFLDKESYERYLETLAKTAEMDKEDCFKAENNEIDITELVREEIILQMPQYPTCVPECKDNSYLEKYSNDGMDSRWAQLLDIKIKN